MKPDQKYPRLGAGPRDARLDYHPGPLGETTPRGIAIGTLTTNDGDCVQMWTLEPGSGREILFLAFMAEFMPRGGDSNER